MYWLNIISVYSYFIFRTYINSIKLKCFIIVIHLFDEYVSITYSP